MHSIATLPPRTILSNDQLCDLFKCSEQGGMRRSHETNTLVIVTNHMKSIYEDSWEGDTIHYTGMGKIGSQSLSFFQNRTLKESPENGVSVHYFEVYKKNQYTYVGEVERCGEPYQAVQPDEEGNERTVWIFPLRLKSAVPSVIDAVAARELYEKKARKASKLSDEELERRAKNAPKRPGSRLGLSPQYTRSPEIAEYAKRRANGHCELCDSPAPFDSKNGLPFLECHHIVWLAKEGEDSVENTVALCPNCHRKMHVLNLKSDVTKLKELRARS